MLIIKHRVSLPWCTLFASYNALPKRADSNKGFRESQNHVTFIESTPTQTQPLSLALTLTYARPFAVGPPKSGGPTFFLILLISVHALPFFHILFGIFIFCAFFLRIFGVFWIPQMSNCFRNANNFLSVSPRDSRIGSFFSSSKGPWWVLQGQHPREKWCRISVCSLRRPSREREPPETHGHLHFVP